MNTNSGPNMWNPPYNAASPTHPAVPNIGSDFEKLKAFFAEQLAPEQRELIIGLNPAPTPLSHAHVQQLKSDYENTYYELGLAKLHMCELIQRVDEQEAIVNDLEEQVSTKKLVWTDAEVALFSQVNQSADFAPASSAPAPSNAQTFNIDTPTPINLNNLNNFTPQQLQELSQHCANLANQRSQHTDDSAPGFSGVVGGAICLMVEEVLLPPPTMVFLTTILNRKKISWPWQVARSRVMLKLILTKLELHP